MRNGLQDLAGEVARLRHECSYFLRQLDELEKLSQAHVLVCLRYKSVATHSIGPFTHHHIPLYRRDYTEWQEKREKVTLGTAPAATARSRGVALTRVCTRGRRAAMSRPRRSLRRDHAPSVTTQVSQHRQWAWCMTQLIQMPV